MEKLKYPIGKYEVPPVINYEILSKWVKEIEELPAQIRAATNELSEEQLDTPYRPEGWTVRQVVHHLADSHMNSFIRFKLTLTEDTPTVKPYKESYWADNKDSKEMAIEPSLKILEGVHERWGVVLNAMSSDEWQKCFYHPQGKVEMSLNSTLGMYAWHGKHHLAHITTLKESKGWA